VPDGTAPTALPVRGTHEERPNPAEAVPGIRPDDRRLLERNPGTPPVLRAGTPPGTMGRPRLPRRRAQEHIAPQLRGGPPPRQDTEQQLAGHDPGLMAAFRRGIGLAEAQQSSESANGTSTGPAAPTTWPSTDVPLPDWPPVGMPRTTEARTVHPAASPETHGTRDGRPAPAHDHPTARHDGSAPAG
jgi:hypothetical protein